MDNDSHLVAQGSNYGYATSSHLLGLSSRLCGLLSYFCGPSSHTSWFPLCVGSLLGPSHPKKEKRMGSVFMSYCLSWDPWLDPGIQVMAPTLMENSLEVFRVQILAIQMLLLLWNIPLPGQRISNQDKPVGSQTMDEKCSSDPSQADPVFKLVDVLLGPNFLLQSQAQLWKKSHHGCLRPPFIRQ